MARGCLTVVLILGVIAIAAAVFVGPTLYREGRAVVGPVVDLARSDKALEALDDEFPFTPAEGDVDVTEQRLLTFLGVRRELKPLYVAWHDTVETVEREHGESWVGAKQTLSSTRDVIAGQIAALRGARMSPAEFRWLEDLVYRRWTAPLGDAAERARQRTIEQLTNEDLEFLNRVEQSHGSSPALRAFRNRLEKRLASAKEAAPISVPGVTPATQQLLWQYRDQIAELDLAGFELHQLLDRHGGTTIHIDRGRVEVDD